MNSDKKNMKIDNENPTYKDLNVEDLEIKDLSFDLEIKPDSNSEVSLNITDSGKTIHDKTLNKDITEKSNDEDLRINNDSGNTLNSNSENNPIDTSSNGSNDISEMNNENTDSQMLDLSDDQDNRSLKERKEDLKDNLKNAKEKIENFPEDLQKKKEDLQKKKEDLQNKYDRAKENVRNLPENAEKKWQDVKDRAKQTKENIKNFPKNKDQISSALKDRLKNSAENAKNNARNLANKAIERGEEGLKDRIENSKPVRAAKKAKRTYDNTKKAVDTTKKVARGTAKVTKAAARTTVKATKGLIDLIIGTAPVILIVIGVVLLVALVLVVAIALAPGKGNVNDSYESQNYSERDNKTLGQLRDLYKKYPDSDAALSMAAVIYPYYSSLQSGNVTYYLNIEDKNWDPDKLYYDSNDLSDEYYEDAEEKEDEDSCEGDDCEAIVGDDMYLELFRKWSYRRKFKKLLKKSNSMSEDEFVNYLKTDYFKSESGYKELFNFVRQDRHEDFANAMIDDLKNLKNYFMNYIYEEVSCSSSSTSLGYEYDMDIIKGEAVILLKDTLSDDFADIKAAKTLFGTDDFHLNLKRYTLGVVYSEVGMDAVKNEQLAKAEMIAVKSFVLGRTAPGSSKTMGMSYGTDNVDGKTIFYLRGNVMDQTFCDIYEGCQEGSRYAKSFIENDDKNHQTTLNVKSALSEADIANFEKWYDETAGEFVFDRENNVFNGAQSAYYHKHCKQGSCMNQNEAKNEAIKGLDYKSILFSRAAYSDKRFTLYNAETKSVAAVATECSNAALTCGIENNDFIYYSQKVGKYSDKVFCNRSDGATIRQSGCGITSMAMVIANLADSKVDPLITNDEAYSGGYCGDYGTSSVYFATAAKKYNLTYNGEIKGDNTNLKKSANKIVNTIKNGGLVIINVNQSWLNGGSGHYIVAKGIDDVGNLIIADPYADSLQTPVRNNISANKVIQDYVNNGHGWFMFTSSKSSEIIEKYCKEESTEGTLVEGDWVKAAGYKLSEIKGKYGKQEPMACYSAANTYGAWVSKGEAFEKLFKKKEDIEKLFNKTPGPEASEWKANRTILLNNTAVYKKIIEEVNKGNAVSIHGGRTNSSSCQEHWVTAVGYRKGFTVDNVQNMTLNDILTIDPADANEKTLSNSLPNGLCTGCGKCNDIIYWD